MAKVEERPNGRTCVTSCEDERALTGVAARRETDCDCAEDGHHHNRGERSGTRSFRVSGAMRSDQPNGVVQRIHFVA